MFFPGTPLGLGVQWMSKVMPNSDTGVTDRRATARLMQIPSNLVWATEAKTPVIAM
jgi:hypothetical protein